MTVIKIKNKRQFEDKVTEYRQKGYNIITFWKCYAELEKGNDIVRVEKFNK